MPAEKLRLVTNKRPLSKAQKDLLIATCERLGFDSANLLLEMGGAVPAHDLDAEASVISSLMLSLDPVWLDGLAQSIAPNDFYSEANAKIFEAIIALNEQGLQFDIVTITHWLRECGALNKYGGPSYLAQLLDGTPQVSRPMLMQHAALIKKLSTRRKLGALCHSIAAESYSNEIAAEPRWRANSLERVRALCEADDTDDYDPSIGAAIRSANTQALSTIKASQSAKWFDVGDLDLLLGRNLGGQVILIKGKSGGGKSAFMGNLAVDVAAGHAVEQYDEKDPIHQVVVSQMRERGELDLYSEPPKQLLVRRGVVVFSLEMKQWEIAQRMACSQALIDSQKFAHNTMTPNDWSYYQAACVYINGLPLLIDDRPALTYERMRLRIKAYRSRMARLGIRLVLALLDNAQLMKPAPNTRFATWEQELSDIGSRIKNELLGEMKDLSFGWLTQIDKITGDPIHCKQLFSHADKVLKLVVAEHVAKGHVEMPSMPRRAKIIVEKNRGGPEGIAHTWFHKRFTRFYDSEFLSPETSQ